MKIFSDFSLIWAQIKGRKKTFYQNFLLAIFVSFLLAIPPYLYGKAIDAVKLSPSDINILAALMGAWLLSGMLSILLNRLINRNTSNMAVDIYVDLAIKSASHLIQLPLNYHKEKKLGESLSKIERAIDSLFNIIDNILFWTVPQFITAFIGVAFMFFINWKLALGGVIFMLVYSSMIILKTRPIIEEQKTLNKSFEKSYGVLYDSVLNVQSVKSNTAENFETEKIKEGYESTGIIYKDYLGKWRSMGFWQESITTFGFIIIFAASIFLLRKGEITIGSLVMFVGYFNLFKSPLQTLSWQWQGYQKSIGALKRLNTIFSEKLEDYNEGGVVLENMEGKVEFEDVSFGYRKKKNILDNISFIAKPGEKVAFVGGSGEGKTTLVSLISLYYKPVKGNILIDGVDISKMNLRFLRENIAYVPQEILLFNDTVLNNIKFGNPKASDSQIIEAAKTANAHDFIISFPKKYNQIVGERGIKLSAGQKQRIAIARALLRDPKILILDEATSSLDSRTEKLVHDAMEKLFSGRTVFIIAHRLSTIKSADKILVIKDRKIVEEGTHEELVDKKGHYFEFYSIQSSHK